MALTTRGRTRKQFFDRDGIRKSISLPGFSKAQARAVEAKIRNLVAAHLSGLAIDPDTAKWVREISNALHEKLAAVGLLQPRSTGTLFAFVDSHVAGKVRKPRTMKNLRVAAEHLESYFGDVPLRSVTPEKARAYCQTLRSYVGLNTATSNLKTARSFFDAAVADGLIDRNPFHLVECKSEVDRSKRFFVTREITRKLMDVAEGEWPLIITFARFGGIRLDSELYGIEWEGVKEKCFRVPSPKTEHHAGHEGRLVPIFPELRPFFVVRGTGRLIKGTYSLRYEFLNLLYKAGVTPWPKLFTNIRSSRATELRNQYPADRVCRWLGHSITVSDRHYFQQTDADFDLGAQLVQRRTESSGTEGAGDIILPRENANSRDSHTSTELPAQVIKLAAWQPRERDLYHGQTVDAQGGAGAPRQRRQADG